MCVQVDLFMDVLGQEQSGTEEVFGEGKEAPTRTEVREDGNKSDFAMVFDNGVVVAGSGGRGYCGESVWAGVNFTMYQTLGFFDK